MVVIFMLIEAIFPKKSASVYRARDEFLEEGFLTVESFQAKENCWVFAGYTY